jgi:hypothetical protein
MGVAVVSNRAPVCLAEHGVVAPAAEYYARQQVRVAVHAVAVGLVGLDLRQDGLDGGLGQEPRDANRHGLVDGQLVGVKPRLPELAASLRHGLM